MDRCLEPQARDGNGEIACMGYFIKWSHNHTSGECEKFVFGGCGGNRNNFGTKEECDNTCRSLHAEHQH